MTLDEAIRIETIDNDHNPDITDEDRRRAHQLGIEAMKRIQEARTKYRSVWGDTLPGETEE